ncbi:RNA pseudouridine synthase [Oesophagostomum dentatum]|uniref:Pseudouridylate synthase RPUSD4, mitochondrial n=1 Tax=Oesophagostomum dentatum TaxID=61180 RepID=A0A0B1T7W4_OESDE|nr:RNA pseudouridine synthase [Oesophagostomum dentatum]
MSEKSAEDDFFGIEYMSSQDQPKRSVSGEKDSRNEVKPINKKGTKAAEDSTEADTQLSGTDFLDKAFFGNEFRHHERIASDHSDQPQDFFEENFFKKMPLKDKNGAAFPSELQNGILKGTEANHHQNRSGSTPVRAPRKHLGKEEHDVGAREEEDVAGPSREGIIQADDDGEMRRRSEELSGLEKIRSKIIPVWNMNQEELVDLMTDRVVHIDDEIIAFDKPYGMAYSGASQNTPQLDRLLQKIKAIVAPKCERLYLVKSLEKYQSGIVLFATNPTMQSTLKECIDNGLMEQVSRCIVRGELNDSPLKITIPLVKTMKNRDMKMMPLISNKAKGNIFYVESECRTIKGNQYVSSVEVITHKDAPHQIRAHLALAGCPLIGDAKYSNSSPRPPRLSNHVLNTLDITDSQSRKIPMYLHLKQINFSGVLKSSKPIRMSAPLPEHFSWMLRKLRLLKLKH